MVERAYDKQTEGLKNSLASLLRQRQRHAKRGAVIWRCVSIALVVFGVWRYIDVQQLVETLFQLDLRLLLVLLGLRFLDRCSMAWKWSQLMRAIAVSVPFLQTLSAYYQSCFINHILPSNAGGDMLRAYLLIRHTGAWERILSSMVVEKVIAILSAGILAIIGLLMLWATLQLEKSVLLLGLPAVVCLGGVAFYLSLSETFAARIIKWIPSTKAQAFVGKLHQSYSLYKSQPWTVVVNFWLAIGEQVLQTFMLYLCARAVGVDVIAWRLFAALLLSQFLWKFALVLEGWVLGGLVMVLMYSLVGVNETQAIAFLLLDHSLGLVSALPGGILFLTTRKGLRHEEERAKNSLSRV